ncbi:putative 2-dehydropantoate 2-reductase [Lentibacillus populi]|uniref:2-dehydropantoate 2-reductase n=1 Tax=Lentibacillus populi TaxID=1827502 RepID=A0A9W5TY76_9BACI|nr:2-dehydropantoate 2-reductase [Lentibacillus populi]GGB45077.1 putative 2-dehydropantoate 2-reductase [Lentibacillus populi]
MKIGVIGGGSIGLLISAYLSDGHEVTIYVRRQEQKQVINEYGIRLAHQREPLSVSALLTEELAKEDCLFICVKQFQVANITPLFNKHQSPIIFLQNGMGHVDLLRDIQAQVFLGIVEHGARKINDHTVAHTGKGGIRVASYNGDRSLLEMMVSKWDRPDFPIELEDDWLSMLGKKLVVNAVINPLTALFGVPNGDIITNPYISTIALELCREAADVLGLDFSEQWNHVKEIASNTKENMSSMWKDIEEGRQTENEAISGYLLHHANHDIPFTQFAYNSIKALRLKKELMD